MHLRPRPRAPRLLLTLRLFFVALVGPLTALASPTPGWPHERSDLAPDPAVIWGQLENGVRYVIRPNAEPRGRVYLVLQVNVGSVHEREDQLGYAHFLEHLMFRGTRRFPANTLTGKLQREGLDLGADSSAFTNYTSTFYNLDLPQNTPEKISLGLSILRDFADGPTLEKAAVKAEAKVVESERRTRESANTRLGDEINRFLLPASRFTQRAPIGTTAAILAATPEKLRAFHREWYRPERLVVIAVGDADPAQLQALIREHFSSLPVPTTPAPQEPDLTLPAAPADTQARFFPSPTDGGTSVLLYQLGPRARPADTRASRRQQLLQGAGFWMLHARLLELARKSPSEIGESEVSWSSDPSTGLLNYVRIDTRRDVWRLGLRLADQELRRALTHGFSGTEVAVQQRALRAFFEEKVRTAAHRESALLAESLRQSLEGDFVFTTPDTEQALMRETLAELTAEQCAEAFRAAWAGSSRRLVVVGNYERPLTTADLLTAYDESKAVTFARPAEEATATTFDYTDFGPAGTIAERTYDLALDTHSLRFANGVRANLKRTDYEAGRVHVRLRLGRGLASEPSGQAGLGLLTAGAFLAGGLNRVDDLALGRLLAGDAIEFNFTAEEDAFYFTGHAEPAALEKFLQVITAFLTDAAFRPEGFAASMGRLQSYYPTLARDPAEFLRAIGSFVVADGDARYGLPPSDLLALRTPEQMTAWLKPVLASGEIEIGIGGDFTLEPALAALSRTLGALPPRQASPPPADHRRPNFPAKPLRETWRLDTTEAKAAVHVYWPGVDSENFHTFRQLQVLASILNDRLRVKIREELGATYGPQSDVWGSDVWRDFGYLYVAIETSPKLVDRVATLTRKIADEIAKRGITPDEFNRAREPRLASLAQEMRDNTYWTYYLLAQLQQKPARREWPLTRVDDYQRMTKADLEALARRILPATRAHTLIARPSR